MLYVPINRKWCLTCTTAFKHLNTAVMPAVPPITVVKSAARIFRVYYSQHYGNSGETAYSLPVFKINVLRTVSYNSNLHLNKICCIKVFHAPMMNEKLNIKYLYCNSVEKCQTKSPIFVPPSGIFCYIWATEKSLCSIFPGYGWYIWLLHM